MQSFLWFAHAPCPPLPTRRLPSHAPLRAARTGTRSPVVQYCILFLFYTIGITMTGPVGVPSDILCNGDDGTRFTPCEYWTPDPAAHHPQRLTIVLIEPYFYTITYTLTTFCLPASLPFCIPSPVCDVLRTPPLCYLYCNYTCPMRLQSDNMVYGRLHLLYYRRYAADILALPATA